jgi:hypothetical protein
LGNVESWNVRILYKAGSLKTARELAKYNSDLVAVQEVIRIEGSSPPADDYIFFFMETGNLIITLGQAFSYTRVYPKVSGLATWSENCKWYSSLPLGAVVSLFYESV